MSKTTVVHNKKEFFEVYIGRPSIWGNPFRIGQIYQGRIMSRADAIEAYRDWFLYSSEGVKLQEKIHELKGKVLGCWCKPNACHGDILAEFADSHE